MTESTSDERPAADPLSEVLLGLDVRFLEPVEDTLATLHHDVGKYMTRIARNVAVGAPVPASLASMLVKDLYETQKGTRASARFAQLVGQLPESLSALPPMREAARALERIDAAERDVRAQDAPALARVVDDAREVERHLALVLRAVRLARVRRGEIDG